MNDFKKLSAKQKVEVITSHPKKVPPLFSALLQSKEFAKYAKDKNLLLLRGSSLSDDDLTALTPLLLLHPDKVICHLIRPENEIFVNLLLSATSRAAQETTDKDIQELYQEVNVGSTKWNRKVRAILERLLPYSTIRSSYTIGLQQKDVEDGIIREMGLRWKVVYHSSHDDGGVQSVPYIVTWFSPQVFFPWLLSHSIVREVLNLPTNILLGTENINAYRQFRFSQSGNEYV